MKNEERQAVICGVLEQGKILTIPELSERTGLPGSSLRDSLAKLVREGKVVRCGYQCGKKLYRLAKKGEAGQISHRVRELEQTGGITPAELEMVKRQARPGTTVRIWNPYSPEEDETGRIVRTKIKAVYPYFAVFENGQSATWAQMAAYWRNRRGFIR